MISDPVYNDLFGLQEEHKLSAKANEKLIKLAALTVFLSLTGVGAAGGYGTYYILYLTVAYVTEVCSEM